MQKGSARITQRARGFCPRYIGAGHDPRREPQLEAAVAFEVGVGDQPADVDPLLAAGHQVLVHGSSASGASRQIALPSRSDTQAMPQAATSFCTQGRMVGGDVSSLASGCRLAQERLKPA